MLAPNDGVNDLADGLNVNDFAFALSLLFLTSFFSVFFSVALSLSSVFLSSSFAALSSSDFLGSVVFSSSFAADFESLLVSLFSAALASSLPVFSGVTTADEDPSVFFSFLSSALVVGADASLPENPGGALFVLVVSALAAAAA